MKNPGSIVRGVDLERKRFYLINVTYFFLAYYGRERLKLNRKAIDRVLSDLATVLPRWFDLLDHALLSPALCTAYRNVLQSRASQLRL